MRVRMLARLAEDGPNTGDVAEVPDADAAELIRCGYAQAVEPAKKTSSKKAPAAPAVDEG